jgi:GntR family transcriptional regulator
VAKSSSSFPAHRIIEDLRTDILSNRRAPGERLPSEGELAQQYGTSRPTVRRALKELKALGLVVSSQGRRAIVRPGPQVRLLLSGENYRKHRRAGLPGFNAQALEQGHVPEQQLREVGTVEAPFDVATRLEVEEGTPVVVRRRLFRVDSHPVAFCDSYYRTDLADGTVLAERRKIKGGVYSVIEDPTGPIQRRVARSLDDLVARMPTQVEVDGLELLPGVPVVRVLRTVYDTSDYPLEVQDSVTAGDRHEFRYEVSMR